MVGELIVFFLSLVICCVVGYVSLQMWFIDKRNRKNDAFFSLSLEIFFWTLLNAIVMVVKDSAFPVLYTIRMVFVCVIPFGINYFILEFTHSPLKDSKIVRFILIFIPVVDSLFLLTNPLTNLYFLDYNYPMPTRATVFWIHLVTGFLFVIIGFTVLISFVIKNMKTNPLLFLTVVGLLIPYTINMLYTFGIITFPHDLTPIGFFFTFVLFTLVSYKSNLFSINVSLFLSTLDLINDSVVVFNENHMVADLNLAAKRMFADINITIGVTKIDDIKVYLDSILKASIPENLPIVFDKFHNLSAEFTIFIDNELKTYLVDYRAVHGLRADSGYILVFSDVSNYREMIKEIVTKNSELEEMTKQAEEANLEKDDMLKTLERQYRVAEAINRAANYLLNFDVDIFEDSLANAFREVGTVLSVDRVYIWKNYIKNNKLYCTQMFEWTSDVEPQQGLMHTVDIPYSEKVPGWEEILSGGNVINGIVSAMTEQERELLEPQGILSVLIAPVFIKGEFWGFVGFDDCSNERVFNKEVVSVLLSSSLLFAHAYQRSEIYENLKNTSEQLEIALQQANAASKAKGDFLSNMSHEMRTPMNAIIGMTSIAINTDVAAEKNNALGRINDAAAHLLGVINDVLDMAKIEADKLELSPVEFNLEQLIQKVISVTYFRVDEKNQNFNVDISSRVPRYIIGDDQRLSQVLTNLISNAIKFTPSSGNISLDIDLIEEFEKEVEISFSITDDGIGISEEQQKKLFGAFVQADSSTSREYGGTGLGLVITKKIIELMGGTITVRSELNKGSCFTATIKVLKGVNKSRSLLDPGVNWSNIRILVVSNNININEHFNDLFDHLEVACDICEDYDKALALIKESGRYDVYFVDYILPHNSGLELAKWVYESNPENNSVVIMISPSDYAHYEGNLIHPGVLRFIVKPIFSSAIIDSINECLGITDKENSKGSALVNTLNGKHLLLVEDIEINREILISLLEDTGISIDCAENGRVSIDMLKKNGRKYDIIFMDVQMPEMDGLEATRCIRSFEDKDVALLPIIAMTANVFKDDIKACLDAGMNNHLGKPLDIDKVIDILNHYLLV